MSIHKRSRFNRCKILSVQDSLGNPTRREYLTPWPRFKEVNFDDNGEHRMRTGDTWSNLAFRFLGSSTLWWVIAEFNRVVDPWKDLRTFIAEGRLIIYPSISRLNFQLLVFDAKKIGRRNV